MVNVTKADGCLNKSTGDNIDNREEKRHHGLRKHAGYWSNFQG